MHAAALSSALGQTHTALRPASSAHTNRQQQQHTVQQQQQQQQLRTDVRVAALRALPAKVATSDTATAAEAANAAQERLHNRVTIENSDSPLATSAATSVLKSASVPLCISKEEAAQQKSSSSARSHSAQSTIAQLPAAAAVAAVQNNSCDVIETATNATTTASTSRTVVASHSLKGPQSIDLRVAATADEKLACGQVLTAFECKLQVVALTVHYLIAAQCDRCCALCLLFSCLPIVQSLMQLVSGATGGALRAATLQQYRQCVKQVAEGAEYIHLQEHKLKGQYKQQVKLAVDTKDQTVKSNTESVKVSVLRCESMFTPVNRAVACRFRCNRSGYVHVIMQSEVLLLSAYSSAVVVSTCTSHANIFNNFQLNTLITHTTAESTKVNIKSSISEPIP
eukprot:1022-Heterococcus_DN1.PRE.3